MSKQSRKENRESIKKAKKALKGLVETLVNEKSELKIDVLNTKIRVLSDYIYMLDEINYV